MSCKALQWCTLPMLLYHRCDETLARGAIKPSAALRNYARMISTFLNLALSIIVVL